MKMSTIRIQKETFDKLRTYGNRTQTDDEVIKALIELAEGIFYSGRSTSPLRDYNEFRHIDDLLMGNVR